MEPLARRLARRMKIGRVGRVARSKMPGVVVYEEGVLLMVLHYKGPLIVLMLFMLLPASLNLEGGA